MESSKIVQAVSRGDISELMRVVDGLCSSRSWEGLMLLRDLCRRAAEERGLQLWPVADFAEYRVALEAPGSYAGEVVVEGAGRFALGPLWEVAASTHAWDTLADELERGPARALAAHERVMRGEDLSADDTISSLVIELPPRLLDWEPGYRLAEYRSHEADFPQPDTAVLPLVGGVEPGERVDDEESEEALRALAKVWSEQSNGSVVVATAEGPALGAAALCDSSSLSAERIQPSDAMAWMAWMAASGGAYGPRPGSPLGRFGAWWVVAALAGLDWPAEPEAVQDALTAMEWWRWAPATSTHGWQVGIAAHLPSEGLSWAVLGIDDRREDDEDELQ